MRRFVLSAMTDCLMLSIAGCGGDSGKSSDDSAGDNKMQTGAAYYWQVTPGISAYDTDPAPVISISKSGNTYTFSNFDVTGD